MLPKKIRLVVTICVLMLTIVGCAPKQADSHGSPPETAVSQGPVIEPSEVEWVTRTGWLPGSKWKVLVPEKAIETIEKITRLINATTKTEYNLENYGHGKVIGYPINIEIKLKNGDLLRISPLHNVTTRKVENGIESTAIAYRDRVLITIESHTEECQYVLMSEELAQYLLNGSDQDIPRI